jgi:hypothetical protein
MMNDKELIEWNKLPDTITAYRFCYDNNRMGFSYTLSKEVAEDFSTYQRYQQKGKAKYIITASISKKYAVLKLDRNEVEIIATRPEKVKILSTRKLSKEELSRFQRRHGTPDASKLSAIGG